MSENEQQLESNNVMDVKEAEKEKPQEKEKVLCSIDEKWTKIAWFLDSILLKHQKTYDNDYQYMINQNIHGSISQTLRLVSDFIFEAYRHEEIKTVKDIIKPSKFIEFESLIQSKKDIIEDYNKKEEFGLECLQKGFINKSGLSQIDTIYLRFKNENWNDCIKWYENGLYDNNHIKLKFKDIELNLYEYMRFTLNISRSESIEYMDQSELKFTQFKIQLITLPIESPSLNTIMEAIKQIKFGF
jgi:hypothetical protein